MTVGWSAEELERIGTAQELRISTSGADGTRRREVPIWVMRVSGHVYVRTWYRRPTPPGPPDRVHAYIASLATGRTNQLLTTHTQPPEALTLGFQRGLLGASIALVIAAVIALRSPNVRVVDMAPDADDNHRKGRAVSEERRTAINESVPEPSFTSAQLTRRAER
jgi:Uncharacterized protein conserved in bacteria (DUF2255)